MLAKLTKQQFMADSKLLLSLVLPIFITQFCQASLGVVDAIMAGRVSALDLAAVSVGSGMWLPLFLLATGILIATTPLIGEAVGQKNHHKVPHITQQALWTALIIGICGFAIVNLMPQAFDLMGVPKKIQPLAGQYLHGVSFGFPALAFYAVLRSYCEALARPEPVTIISVLGLLADIPLNYAFIYGNFGMPAMGGAGCGVATAIVLWINVLLLGAYLTYSTHHKFTSTRFFYGFASPNRNQINKLLKLGIPIGISVFFEASLFSFAALVISPLGELAVAAHQVALSVTSQLFMIPLSIAMALTIMVSNRYGEQNLLKIKQVQTTGLLWAIGIASVCVVVMFFWRGEIAQLFTKDAEVQTLAVGLLFYAMVYQIFDAWQVNVAGVLRGIQDTKTPMLITLFCYWIVALPLGIYLVRYTNIGAQGFWIALVVGLLLAAILLSVRLKKQMHKLKSDFK